MENIAVEQPKSSETSSADAALEEMFIVPYESVTIIRPLGPYGRMLSLSPGVRSAPNADFLYRLLTNHSSHQALLRTATGDQFKNLENLIRGRHQVSATTRSVLAARLQCGLDFIAELDGSAPNGPLLPGLQQLVQLFEGIPSWLAGTILSVNVPCPCCGANMVNDVDVWWQRHAPSLGEAEYRFVERLLRALIGASLCELLAHHLAGARPPSLGNLSVLANPVRHPIGNWLGEILAQLEFQSLSQLTAHMQLKGHAESAFAHGRLRTWSSGQDDMPFAEGQILARSVGTPPGNERRLCAARTIALATDFIMASAPGDDLSKRSKAQTVLDARVRALSVNTELVCRRIAGKLSITPAATPSPGT